MSSQLLKGSQFVRVLKQIFKIFRGKMKLLKSLSKNDDALKLQLNNAIIK